MSFASYHGPFFVSGVTSELKKRGPQNDIDISQEMLSPEKDFVNPIEPCFLFTA